MSFRYQPKRRLAFESGLELLAGRDADGLKRAEFGLVLSGLFFFNPQHPCKVYGLFSPAFSSARLEAPDDLAFKLAPERRSYVSGLLGLGVEWQVASFLALGADLGAQLRQRLDSRPAPRDAAGSQLDEPNAAGVLRLGVALSWD